MNQRGGSTPPFPDPGWGVEIALDVQAVSAACPRCNILLVEADDPSLINIGKSVNTAVRLGADIVSNSYGTDEFNGILGLAATYYTIDAGAPHTVCVVLDHAIGCPGHPREPGGRRKHLARGDRLHVSAPMNAAAAYAAPRALAPSRRANKAVPIPDSNTCNAITPARCR